MIWGKVMYSFEEIYIHRQLIDEGILITAEEVFEQFRLTEVDLEKAVKSGGIAKPLETLGAKYYHSDIIEKYVSNIRRKSSGTDEESN